MFKWDNNICLKKESRKRNVPTFPAFPTFPTIVVVLRRGGVGHFVLNFLQHVFQEIVRFDPTLLLHGASAAHADGVLLHFVAADDHDVVVLAFETPSEHKFNV